MIQYVIMSFMMGYTGNKLFNKEDKSLEASMKWGAIAGTVALLAREAISRL